MVAGISPSAIKSTEILVRQLLSTLLSFLLCISFTFIEVLVHQMKFDCTKYIFTSGSSSWRTITATYPLHTTGVYHPGQPSDRHFER